MQENKTHQIPNGFIQESGVVVLRHAGIGIQYTHPQKESCLFTMGLPVEEIAPTANRLTDQKSQRGEVQSSTQRELFDFAIDNDADGCANDTAVNGKTAVPNVEHFNGICLVLVPSKYAVIGSGANNGKGNDRQSSVKNVILGQTKLLASAQAVNGCQQDTKSNQQSIIIDGCKAQIQLIARVYFNAQIGERNGGITH